MAGVAVLTEQALAGWLRTRRGWAGEASDAVGERARAQFDEQTALVVAITTTSHGTGAG